MNALHAAQDMARKNNENAAVHAAYRRRRQRRLGIKRKAPRSKLAKRLDELDWQAAEREARPVRAIGFFLG
jgi:hypothetical protein